jgi:AcrR family transcriptional regulator
MSLYRHAADKDDLLLKMMDAAFGECRFPAHPPDGWRDQLELAARTLWAMFHRHPWLAPALSVTRPQPIARGLTCTEWVLNALDGRGLDLSTMLTIHITLVNYVRGTAVNLELEADAEAASSSCPLSLMNAPNELLCTACRSNWRCPPTAYRSAARAPEPAAIERTVHHRVPPIRDYSELPVIILSAWLPP